MVAIIEYDSNEQRWIDHRNGTTPVPPIAQAAEAAGGVAGDAWRQALAVVAAQMDAEPFKPRLEAAMELVSSGRVDDVPFEGVQVRSNGHTYTIDPETGCPCGDARNRSKWCKHAVAWELFKRTMARLAEGQGEVGSQDSSQCSVGSSLTTDNRQLATPASLGWQQQEPPYLHSLKYHLDGIEHMTVIRANDIDSLWKEVRTCVQLIQAARAQAQLSEGRVVSSQSAPTTAPTDNRQLAPPVLQSPPPMESWCAVHGLWMRWNASNGKGPGWWSHKGPDGAWCKGTSRKAGR